MEISSIQRVSEGLSVERSLRDPEDIFLKIIGDARPGHEAHYLDLMRGLVEESVGVGGTPEIRLSQDGTAYYHDMLFALSIPAPITLEDGREFDANPRTGNAVDALRALGAGLPGHDEWEGSLLAAKIASGVPMAVDEAHEALSLIREYAKDLREVMMSVTGSREIADTWHAAAISFDQALLHGVDVEAEFANEFVRSPAIAAAMAW